MCDEDEILDRLELFCQPMLRGERRQWERYFEGLLLERAHLEAHVVKGIFRHVERQQEIKMVMPAISESSI